MDVVAGVAVAAVSKVMLLWYNLKMMQWISHYAKDLVIGFVVLTLFCGLVAYWTYFPDFQRHSANAGFGPDWECSPQPYNSPVCIKKPGR
jgi:hypothetical protein